MIKASTTRDRSIKITAPPAMSASPFASVPVAPDDPILGLNARFLDDKDPRKINLGVGAYRTEEGKPLVLNVVRKAEQRIFSQTTLNKEYIPIDGLKDFQDAAARLAFGDHCAALHEGRVVTLQALSGTGAVRLGASFVGRFFPKGTIVYLSAPTWGNHHNIFRDSGCEIKTYRYWNAKTNGLDFEGLISDFQSAPEGSVIVLHACAHNPTGVDPTPEQWEKIANVLAAKGHTPFIDCAYQGFASGDTEKDAVAIRIFERRGFQLFLAQSFAKNMGLYGERIGALNVICGSKDEANAVRSQFKAIIRPMYSSPQLHGARIVVTILNDPELNAEWRAEVKGMADRINLMRQELFNALKTNGTPGDWSHVLTQIGMFSFTGLKPEQVDVMISKHHVYMTRDGRISMAGLSTKNVGYLADAIKDVVLNVA